MNSIEIVIHFPVHEINQCVIGQICAKKQALKIEQMP